MFQLEHYALCSNWNIRAILLAFVDGRVGMVVAPVEPVVFERGDAIEALALREPGNGAALEVPLAGGGAVDQRPVLFDSIIFRSVIYSMLFRIGAFPGRSIACVIALEKEFGVVPVDAAHEDPEGFAVGA